MKLSEVKLLQGYKEKDAKVLDSKEYNPGPEDGWKKISSIEKTGHDIYSRYDADRGNDEIIAHNPTTNKIDIHLKGHLKAHPNGNQTFSRLDLSGREGSSLKAHEFYNHLINQHNYILHTKAQSPGGMKVWRKLQKTPGVHIHSWQEHERDDHGALGKAEPVSRIGLGYTHGLGMGYVERPDPKNKRALYRSLVAHRADESEVPANNAGDGQIAGIGVGPNGVPGFRRKRKTLLRRLILGTKGGQ